MVKPVVAGKSLMVIGNAGMPHSFTYVPDLAAAMIVAAQDHTLWNTVWHAPTGPALSQREIAAAFATAGRRPAPRVAAVPGWVLRTMGMFSPGTRELAETLLPVRAPVCDGLPAAKPPCGYGPTPLTDDRRHGCLVEGPRNNDGRRHRSGPLPAANFRCRLAGGAYLRGFAAAVRATASDSGRPSLLATQSRGPMSYTRPGPAAPDQDDHHQNPEGHDEDQLDQEHDGDHAQAAKVAASASRRT